MENPDTHQPSLPPGVVSEPIDEHDPGPDLPSPLDATFVSAIACGYGLIRLGRISTWVISQIITVAGMTLLAVFPPLAPGIAEIVITPIGLCIALPLLFALPTFVSAVRSHEPGEVPGQAPRLMFFLGGYGIAWFAYVLLELALITTAKVPTAAMNDTIPSNSRVFVSDWYYWVHPVERGDIIVFEDTGLDIPPPYSLMAPPSPPPSARPREFIKRVFAIAGDHVENRGGSFRRNGQKVEEPYLKVSDRGLSSISRAIDLVIPDGHVFVMGDNRTNSMDSRRYGPVPLENVVGKFTHIFKVGKPHRNPYLDPH